MKARSRSTAAPSPCPKTTLNFPYETQRTADPSSIGALAVNGWAYLNFIGGESAVNNSEAPRPGLGRSRNKSFGVAFVNASVPAVQLDPSSCAPEGLSVPNGPEFPDFVWPGGLGHN